MKRFISILLAMALAIPIFWIGNPFSPAIRASADTYRKGYALVAEKADKTGILPDTAFLLTVPQGELDAFAAFAQSDKSGESMAAILSRRITIRKASSSKDSVVAGTSGATAIADGTTPAAILFSVEAAGKTNFTLKPSESFDANTLYFIDLASSDKDVVTFAFQTRRDYGVVGTLPTDKSSGVPVDTGIEVYFTHAGVSELDSHFSISPKVDGRFEVHGQTVAFVPRKPLAPGTLYTVNVRKGLPLSGTEQTLSADLTFSFETSPDPEKSANPDAGYLSISSSWLESAISDKPVIPFDAYLPEALAPGGKADIGVNVFKFADDKAFIKALQQKDKVPGWAWYNWSLNMIPTTGLQKSLSYVQPLDLSISQARYTILPETLPAGFYLVELQTGNKETPLKAQVLLQVTDTTAWFIEDNSALLFWVNSLKSGGPIEGMTVESLLSGIKAETGKDGLAKVEKGTASLPDGNTPEYFRLTGKDGAISIYNSGYPVVSSTGSGVKSTMRYGYPTGSEGNFWRYSGTDRTLYKPSDTVKYWGFARSRLTGVSPEQVTVEIAQGGWMYPWMDSRSSIWMPMLQKPLISTTLPVRNGFWDGSLALPALDPGYYTLSVKAGDETISTSGFTVENYKKPAYQITVRADKVAIFPGETANFTVTAAFFDGTPVANQPIRYAIQEAQDNVTGEGKTNGKGELVIPYKAKYFDGQQGEVWTSFNATAVLPEAGEISAFSSLRVFMNDILVESVGDVVNADGTTGYDAEKDLTGRIFVTVNKANLVPLNDADPDNDSFLKGAAVSGKTFRGTVTRTTWVRVETGEDYDFVNKVVVPRYEYQEKRETMEAFTFTTGTDGKGTWAFPIPAGSDGYYTTEFTTTDAQGHDMSFSTWHAPSGYSYPNQGVWNNFVTDKSAYRIGEPIKASIEKNTKEPVSGRTLFVESWNGIKSFTVAAAPKYETVFTEAMMPNLTLDGVLFDGHSYQALQNSIAYDSEEKRITFETTTDKETYRPGDTVTVTIKAKDPMGKPVPATLNVALVDEALFKLADQSIDVLPTLYGWMDNGIIRRAGNTGYINPMMYGGRGGMDMAFAESASMEMPAPSAAVQMTRNKSDMAVGGADEAYVVRSDFRDSAYFAMKTLDESGTGTLTFKLPDNVTSWRVTVSGISQALQGGAGTGTAVVSLPFFLSETLNDTYLAGDEPQVGFTAYGTDLMEGEDVDFNVTSPDLPELDATISTKAFERVHLPLGKLKEGTYKFILKAKSASGLTDAMERTVTVVGSFREMQKTTSAKLEDGMSIQAGTKGLTRLTVSDPARALLLQSLQNLAWSGGHRLDQRLVSSSAQKWLNELILAGTSSDGTEEGNTNALLGLWNPETVDVGTYRREDGGYGILPYAPSDLRMTALLSGLLRENGDTAALKTWLYGKVLSTDNPAPAALYGLAALGEPVLMELEQAAKVETATLEETLFLILGYSAIGDLSTARVLWDEKVAPVLETAAPYVRVKNGTAGLSGTTDATNAAAVGKTADGKDESLQFTALASAAASALQLPSADGLHRWVMDNGSKNVFTGIEDLLYVKSQFKSLPTETLSFTWTYAGKTYDEKLENGAMAFITIASAKVGDLRISGVSGNGAVTSTFAAPQEPVSNDPNLQLKRTYYNESTGNATTTFAMNDLVRVELDWDISANAMDSTYEVSDYLPAGMTAVDNPWEYGIRPAEGFWYRTFEGQKADFVIGRDWQLNHKIVYYARVTSPGTYTAEGSVVQGSLVRSSQMELPGTLIVIDAN